MSITRLQQARQMYALGQLVSKSMDGLRPGYRGEAAAASDAAAGRDAGRSNTGSPSGRGDGPASTGDSGDRREQRSVATTQGISPTSQSALGIDRSAVGQFSQYGKNVMNQSLDSLRPAFGFTDAARTNLLSPKSLATTAFNALIGIPGLDFLSNFSVNPISTVPHDSKTRGEGGGESRDLSMPVWAQLGYPSYETFLEAQNQGIMGIEGIDLEDETEVDDFIQRFKLADAYRQQPGTIDTPIKYTSGR